MFRPHCRVHRATQLARSNCVELEYFGPAVLSICLINETLLLLARNYHKTVWSYSLFFATCRARLLRCWFFISCWFLPPIAIGWLPCHKLNPSHNYNKTCNKSCKTCTTVAAQPSLAFCCNLQPTVHFIASFTFYCSSLLHVATCFMFYVLNFTL